MSGGEETWAVLLAGELRATARLRAQVAGARAVAADAGIAHARMLGLQPRTWVGDFDSTLPALLEQHAHVPRIHHPADKNMTDGALAIAHALERGARRLVLVGAMGGRSDHALAHLLQLAELAGRGIVAVASSGMEEAHGLAAGEWRIDLPEGTVFSLLGFEVLEDVHLKGAKWPLAGERLDFASTRPLSNVVLGPLELRIGKGRGVLLASLSEEKKVV